MSLRNRAIAGVTVVLALALGAVAQNASSQGGPAGNDAFSTFYPGPEFGLPSDMTALMTLDIPEPGSYVVNAKLQIGNFAPTEGRGLARCSLAPRQGPGDPPPGFGDSDLSTIDLERDRRGMLMLQFTHRFRTPGEVVLRCLDGGTSLMRMNHVWITAHQVDSETKIRFIP